MFLLQLGLFCPSDQTIDGLDVQYNNDADVRGKHGSWLKIAQANRVDIITATELWNVHDD
jgi:hypothetical protein